MPIGSAIEGKFLIVSDSKLKYFKSILKFSNAKLKYLKRPKLKKLNKMASSKPFFH